MEQDRSVISARAHRWVTPSSCVLALMTLILSGCGEEPRPQGLSASAEIADSLVSSDSLVFEHAAGAIPGATALRIATEPLIRIGTDDGPFWGPVSGTRLSDGTLVLLDRGRKEVLVFDPRGALVRSMGAEGAGPGEFELTAGLQVTDTGTVSVWDTYRQRVAVFRWTDGDLLSDDRLPVDDGVFSITTPIDGGPTFLLASERMSMPVGGGEITTWHRMLEWDRAEGQVQDLARFPGGVVEIRVSDGGMARPIVNRWYQPAGYAVAAPDGVWTAYGGSWELRRLRYSDGAADRVVRFDEPLVTIDDDVAGRFLEAELARAEPEGRDWVRARHAGTDYPESLPTVRGLHVDSAGWVWIRVAAIERLLQAPAHRSEQWVILADQGARIEGQVTLPAGRRLIDAGSQGVLTTAETELGGVVVEWWPFEGA